MTPAGTGKTSGRRPRLVAHRGLHDEERGGARENTMAAIRGAVAAGASAVEVDVRTTRDGAVVLLHDATLERLWGDPRAVASVDLAELRELGGGDRRIPLLTEALEELRGTRVALLIDMDEPWPATAAAEVVREHERPSRREAARTAWCGDAAAMRIVRERLPEAEIWMPWDRPEVPRPGDLAELRPAVVNVRHLIAGPGLVEAVHALGAEVSCWTVDEPAQIAHLAGIGVDSITTNRLPEARHALDAGGDDAGGSERARELLVAQELAAHAAEATRRAWCEGAGVVETKAGPADLVTEVDRAVERHVRQVLTAQFPDHALVGEEYGGTEAPSCWYVDPVDGTTNLANGLPWTSFSLALVEEGRPVVAAVLDPVGPTPVLAAAGRGAWREGRRLETAPRSEADPLRGAIVSTELAGCRPWPGLHELLDRLAARHCTVRVSGSGTATLAGVALGRGAAALIHRYSPLDHAAAVLLVTEAGGVVLDADGEPSSHPLGGAVIAACDERTARTLWQEWRAAAS